MCLICHCNVLLQSCRRDSMTSKYANYLHTIFVVSPTRSFIFGLLQTCNFPGSWSIAVPFRSPAVPRAAPFASGSRANHHTSLREDFSTNAKTALEKHVCTMTFYVFSKEHESSKKALFPTTSTSTRVFQQTRATCSKKALRAIHNSVPPPPKQQ